MALDIEDVIAVREKDLGLIVVSLSQHRTIGMSLLLVLLLENDMSLGN